MRLIRNIAYVGTREFWAVILCAIGVVLMCCVCSGIISSF